MEQGLKEPFIEETEDFVGVRFSRDSNIEKEKVSESIGKHKKVSEQEKIILNYVMKHSKITSKNVEEIMGVKEARARRILKEMTNKKYIVKQGQSRSTCYVLNNEDENI